MIAIWSGDTTIISATGCTISATTWDPIRSFLRALLLFMSSFWAIAIEPPNARTVRSRFRLICSLLSRVSSAHWSLRIRGWCPYFAEWPPDLVWISLLSRWLPHRILFRAKQANHECRAHLEEYAWHGRLFCFFWPSRLTTRALVLDSWGRSDRKKGGCRDLWNVFLFRFWSKLDPRLQSRLQF